MKSLPTLLLLSMFWMVGAQGQTAPDSPTLDSLRKAAQSAQFTAKKPAEAIELWSQILQQHPEDNQALRFRSAAYADTGQHALAERDAVRATELEPNNGDAWGSLCWGRILANRPLEARPACEKAVALDSGSMPPTVNLGHTWLLAGDADTAQHWYQKTLPLINSESGLKEGPLADFDLFIARGWKVEASRKARAWFAEHGSAWLARKAPADSLFKQAQDAEKAGDKAQAIALYQERLPLLEGLYGPEDLRVGTALSNLAVLLYTTGRYAEAEPLFRRALAITENAHGPEHPTVGTHLNNLALLLKTTGRYAEAEPLFRRALAIGEKAHGPEHPAVGSRLHNLALLLETTGRYAEAEPLYRRALAITENAHGPEHPTVGTHLNNLAAMLLTTGRYADAEPLNRRALAIAEKAYGPEHPDVGIALAYLALLLQTTGRYAEAEPLFRRALTITEKAHDPEHPDVGNHLNNLALLLYTTGRYGDAEPLFRRALAIAEKAHGPEHPDVGTRLNNLAELLRTTGRYADAEPLYRRALAIDEKAHGPEHPTVGTHLNNLALLLETTGRYAEAEPLFHRALSITEKSLGPAHPNAGSYLNNLALLLETTGRYADAEPLYRRALAIDEKAHGPEHPNVGLHNLAGLLETTGRYAEAEPLFRRALTIAEKAHGPEHPEVGTCLNGLAGLLQTTGRYAEAEPLYRRALAISEKAEGPEHPSTGGRLNNLAVLLQTTGRYAEAEPLARRAWRIARHAGEPDLLRYTQSRMSDQLSAQGRHEAAIFFGKQAVNTLQGLRANVANLGKETLKSFDGTIESTYRTLSKLLITESRLVEAERVLELLKEQEQFQFLRRDASVAPLAGRAPLTAFEKAQQQKLDEAGAPLARLYAEMIALEDKPQRSADEDARLKGVRQALAEADAAFDAAFDVVLVALSSARREDKADSLKDAQGLQDTLRELTERSGEPVAALYTVVTPDSYDLILTTADYRRAYSVPLTSGALNDQIATFRTTLTNRTLDPVPQARALLDIVLPPAARAELAQARVGTLMWHLDGALRLLPLAALHDGKGYLIERYRLASFTSAGIDKIKDAPKARWNGLGLGVSEARTIEQKHFNALPAVAQELDTVIRYGGTQGVVPGMRHLNDQFNWATLQDELKRKGKYPLIHIASHFNLEPGNDTMSFLLPGAGDPITLAQLTRQNNLFGGVDLLTLSACETAVGGGRSSEGKEVDGLSFIAQRQGAKSVLATLWPVADASTAQLMERFYRLREDQKLTKAEALRQAQLSLMGTKVGAGGTAERGGVRTADGQQTAAFVPDPKAPFAHPYYWAPFILMGNWL